MTPSGAGLLALAAVALVGGIVNAIAGGGSLILFPSLVASGLGTVPANVTNSVALWPGYLGNAAALWRDLRAEVHGHRSRFAAVSASSAAGTLAGALLLLLTPVRAFDIAVPVLVLGATALLAAGPRIRARLGHSDTRPGPLNAAVVLASVYGGYFGGGLGVILLAVLGLTYGGDLRVQNAVKAWLQVVVSTVALVVFALDGPVDWPVAGLIAPAALVGGVIGGRLTRVVTEVWLRRVVVAFGVAVGAWLAYRAVAGG